MLFKATTIQIILTHWVCGGWGGTEIDTQDDGDVPLMKVRISPKCFTKEDIFS